MVVLSSQTDEEIRSLCGLSRTQWDILVGSDMSFTPTEIKKQYAAFMDGIRNRLEREFRRPAIVIDGVPYLSTVQAAEALDVGEYHLSTMRSRGKLEGTKHGRRTIYSQGQMQSFLMDVDQAQNRKSALALAFLRRMERKRQD